MWWGEGGGDECCGCVEGCDDGDGGGFARVVEVNVQVVESVKVGMISEEGRVEVDVKGGESM